MSITLKSVAVLGVVATLAACSSSAQEEVVYVAEPVVSEPVPTSKY